MGPITVHEGMGVTLRPPERAPGVTVEEIKARGDHDGRTRQRPGVGHIAEYQVAEGHRARHALRTLLDQHLRGDVA